MNAMVNLGAIKPLLKKHRYAFSIGVFLLIGLIFWSSGQDEVIAPEAPRLPLVTVTTAANLTGEESVSVIGTARAFSEAAITAETSGRITSVNATLGRAVPTGFVIATLENASERAAVLQAEGVYEAAVAASAQSDVGQAEAETGLLSAKETAITTLRTTYSTVDSIIRTSVDQFFSDPDSRFTPGLRINGEGYTATLNEQRVQFTTALPAWQNRIDELTTNSNFSVEIEYAKNEVERAIRIVSTFITVFNEQENYSRYTEEEVTAFASTFGTLRNNLITLRSQLDNAETRLLNAEDAVRRAGLAGTGGTTSAADAQVKQALGTLRSAQAALSKTILSTPVSGTVNALNVRVGDFIGTQAVVARVANNDALEIVTFVGDKELIAFSVGSTVMIEDVYEGIVTAVAPAVDPATRKTEVRIALETTDIKNGDTVTITNSITPETLVDAQVFIPLSAVKFEIDKGFVFTVVDDTLQPRPVELGLVRGGSVEILSGLTATDEFVLDARGLVADTKVEVRAE
jgi:multidrug efflux pump subunit AcrA (membrane-fusion protein)